jgi:hypothetical protein
MNSKLESPAIPRVDTLPSHGYVLSVDGKLKAKFEAPEEALAMGLKLKQAYPVLHVQVFDAQARTYTRVLLPDAALISKK